MTAGAGKTLLAGAAAHEAGALLFDLSPATTAGLYPGKQVSLSGGGCKGWPDQPHLTRGGNGGQQQQQQHQRLP